MMKLLSIEIVFCTHSWHPIRDRQEEEKQIIVPK